MISKSPSQPQRTFYERFLQIINLRPGEGERTLLMFAFYTATSMGIVWLEVSSAALFLDSYGAQSLPLIYIFSAGVGFSLSVIYSWLQRFFPLRRVIVVMAVLIALPILGFRWGLDVPYLMGITVFVMRLWMEAIYSSNDLNVSVTANQLFNIREIKRAYPIISSGNLVADVLSGFSVSLLLILFDLKNVLLLSFVVMMVGSVILMYLSYTYAHAFPDSLKRQMETAEVSHSTQQLRGSMRQYVILLLSFFVLAQILMYLIEFGYLSQVEANLTVEQIAQFLGIFSGVLGLIELLTQWFTSSRLIENKGVFTVSMMLPLMIISIGSITLVFSWPSILGGVGLFLGLVALKFFDEWLRYTLVASTRPVLFQPIPDSSRTAIQSLVGGIAEPVSMGFTGALLMAVIAVCNALGISTSLQNRFFLVGIVVLAVVWLGAIYLLRSQYLNLLVLSAERGLLSVSDANLRVLKRAFIDQLEQPGSEADKRSCVELLSHIDPQGVGDVLAPMLLQLSPSLQHQSLEAMLEHPHSQYVEYVRALIQESRQPEVLALALRYVWITEENPDINALRPYLAVEVDPVVRGTAASLMLRRGSPQQKAEATNTLRQMLTHTRERERVMGCRALGEAVYMQALRLYIPNLLQDESLRVRRALLDAIASTHLEEYYPSLLRALQYKSTRDAAIEALIRLGNDALPMLTEVALDVHRPESLRFHAWQVIGSIGSQEALDILVSNLLSAWGSTRRCILKILLRLSQETGFKRSPGIDLALDRLGRQGVEQLLTQELKFIGQIYAVQIDLSAQVVQGQEADLFRDALHEMEGDALERLFMLMRFIYPNSAIQAAQVSLQGSVGSRARGLEILDNTLDIPSKRAVLTVLDRRPDLEKLQSLAGLVSYTPMSASDRLRYLLDLRYFLSEWGLACCFHLARTQRWSVTPEHILSCLRHPTGFVREAVLSYLRMASPRALAEVLPLMRNDPNELVAAQVNHLLKELESAGQSPQSTDRPAGHTTDSSVSLNPLPSS